MFDGMHIYHLDCSCYFDNTTGMIHLKKIPVLYLLILLTGKVLRHSNFAVGGSKPARNIIVFKLFLFDKDSCYCIVLLPKNSVARIDNDLERL